MYNEYYVKALVMRVRKLKIIRKLYDYSDNKRRILFMIEGLFAGKSSIYIIVF